MAAPTLLLVSFFLIWLIIAIVAPWKFAPSRVKGNLIPILRFGYSNNRPAYHLEYRLKDHDQEVSEWKGVPIARRSTGSSVNYFPAKRERRPLHNSERVIKLLRQHGYRKTAHHDSYWYLMNYLQQADDAAAAQALQFRIVARKAYGQQGNGDLIFISDWHVQ